MTKSRRAILGAAALGTAVASVKAKPAEAQAGGFTGAISVSQFGAVGDGKTDDSAAIIAACNHAVAQFNAGSQCYLKFPSGNFLVNSKRLPTFNVPIGIVGAGAHQTVFTIGPNYSGDLFSWSNCWMRDAYGPSQMNPPSYAGASVQDIGITGYSSSSNKVNALAFYNINDFVRVKNVEFNYIPGRAIYCGASNDKNGFGILRESRFNEIRIFNSGAAGYPCIEISSCGTSDGTNELSFGQIDIYKPGGHGFLIHNNGTEPVRLIKIFGLRIEDVSSGYNGLQVGSVNAVGPTYGINVVGMELVCCNSGSAALAILGSPTMQVSSCYFQGQIVNCSGNGILVNTGFGNKIVLLSNDSSVGLTIYNTIYPLYYDCAQTQNSEKFSIAANCRVYSPAYTPFVVV